MKISNQKKGTHQNRMDDFSRNRSYDRNIEKKNNKTFSMTSYWPKVTKTNQNCYKTSLSVRTEPKMTKVIMPMDHNLWYP